jgi:gluconate 5-dehydrogenase
MTKRFSLGGQVAVVTGASRGLGFEMARAIAESGAKVWMTARGREQLEESAAKLRGEGHDVAVKAFDLANGAACVDAIREIGAALAVVGRENVTAYVSSKHGLAGMTRAMAAELGPMGITVNMMAPGYFLTEINTAILARPGYEKGVSSRIPLGRWGDPEEAGGVVAFMASKASGYMNGHVLVVDGGLTETFVLPVDAA